MNTVKTIKRDRKLNVDWISNLSFSALPRIKEVAFIRDEIAFILSDDRIIYIPLDWSKKLKKATHTQRANNTTNGIHVFWDDIDEIIGVKNILFGKELFL